MLLVAEVREVIAPLLLGGLLEELGEHEGLEHGPELRPVLGERGGRHAAQRREQARVEEVQLGRAGEPGQAAARPGGQVPQQVELLEDPGVALRGDVGQAQRGPELRVVDELP